MSMVPVPVLEEEEAVLGPPSEDARGPKDPDAQRKLRSCITNHFDGIRHAWVFTSNRRALQGLRETSQCAVCGDYLPVSKNDVYSCGHKDARKNTHGCFDGLFYCFECYTEELLETPQRFSSLAPIGYLQRRKAIALLDATAFASHVLKGGRLAPRQHGIVHNSRMYAFKNVDQIPPGKLKLMCLSYGWLAPGHPDPACLLAKEVGEALKRLRQEEKSKDAVHLLFWDFLSLHQHLMKRKRNSSEEKLFRLGLSNLDTLYSNTDPSVYFLRCTIIPPDRTTVNRRLYHLRGWTNFESARGACKRRDLVIDVTKKFVEPQLAAWLKSSITPISPDDFRALLASGGVRFTNEADTGMVSDLYTRFLSLHTRARKEVEAVLTDDGAARLTNFLSFALDLLGDDCPIESVSLWGRGMAKGEELTDGVLERVAPVIARLPRLSRLSLRAASVEYTKDGGGCAPPQVNSKFKKTPARPTGIPLSARDPPFGAAGLNAVVNALQNRPEYKKGEGALMKFEVASAGLERDLEGALSAFRITRVIAPFCFQEIRFSVQAEAVEQGSGKKGEELTLPELVWNARWEVKEMNTSAMCQRVKVASVTPGATPVRDLDFSSGQLFNLGFRPYPFPSNRYDEDLEDKPVGVSDFDWKSGGKFAGFRNTLEFLVDNSKTLEGKSALSAMHRISLSGAEISDNLIEISADYLAELRFLKVLDLSYNQRLTPQGCLVHLRKMCERRVARYREEKETGDLGGAGAAAQLQELVLERCTGLAGGKAEFVGLHEAARSMLIFGLFSLSAGVCDTTGITGALLESALEAMAKRDARTDLQKSHKGEGLAQRTKKAATALREIHAALWRARAEGSSLKELNLTGRLKDVKARFVPGALPKTRRMFACPDGMPSNLIADFLRWSRKEYGRRMNLSKVTINHAALNDADLKVLAPPLA
eukprot:Cvel_12682.t1-p1 / transcript=Cvel_12682.t1 / gene=Cvel_12682 / organism=Chromera_velia_CCMP2878 / gene_product=hypothetical protein / transcript_product=hypothetical protein / location=Cvel_scaffold838:60142-65049(+) / protein_length=933 / sequence_SO=supercontig / SO=protein_coding / is_pseudo=false